MKGFPFIVAKGPSICHFNCHRNPGFEGSLDAGVRF